MIPNNITQLSSLTDHLSMQTATRTRGTESFDAVFTAAMQMFNTANTAQIEADVAQIDFITGQTDNMLAVLLAQERAFASMNFTVNVVNRAVGAYQEIMRMQV